MFNRIFEEGKEMIKIRCDICNIGLMRTSVHTLHEDLRIRGVKELCPKCDLKIYKIGEKIRHKKWLEGTRLIKIKIKEVLNGH